MHTFTMVVGSTDGNTFRTEGKGRTTTITLTDGKLLPCISTRVSQRHTSGLHEVPLPVDRLAVEAGLLLWFLVDGGRGNCRGCELHSHGTCRRRVGRTIGEGTAAVGTDKTSDAMRARRACFASRRF